MVSRVEIVSKRIGSFANSIVLPPPYPNQQLRYLDTSQNCDSCSSSSCSGSDDDDQDEISRARRGELSTSGSFSESLLQREITAQPSYPQSCFIPSLSAMDELSMPDTIPVTSSTCHRRQIFKRESKTGIVSGEQQIMYSPSGLNPLSKSLIPSNNTYNFNNDGSNENDHDDGIVGTLTNNEWLQSSTECYSNSHNHNVLPVVLEEDEIGAISSPIDLEQYSHTENEIKEKTEPEIKTSNLCSSINGENLDTILTTHNFYDESSKINQHHDNNSSDKFKVHPATDTIGSDTYQTQSLSNHSLSTTSKDHERSPSPRHFTNHNQLEEELESRLQVIMALKDVVLGQNKNSKKAAKLHKKTNSKLVSCTRSNQKLNKRNKQLEDQVESMQKELMEMKRQMMEAQIELVEKRKTMYENENLDFGYDDIFYDGNSYEDGYENKYENDMASF